MRKYIYYIIEALIFILIILCFKNCNNNEINILKHNLETSQDTIEMYRMKNNELLYEKLSYIGTEKELREQLDITKSELNDIKKKVGVPVYISKVETKVIYDTIRDIQTEIIYKDNTILSKFNYNDDWLKINGENIINDSVSICNINNLELYTPFTVGLTDNYKVFVSTPNPYIKISDINSVVIDKKLKSNKKWSFGVDVGIGIQYGIFNKNFDIGPQLGIGIHYNF